MSKRNKERVDRYFVLHHYMLKTDAWTALSTPARAVYVQIGLRYDGFNNGKIAYSVRDAASERCVAINTASKAFKELVELGFIEETRHGGLSKKTRIASEWRMTAFKCDLTGGLKTCVFMQRGEVARASRLRYRRPQEPGPKLTRACIKRRSPASQTTVQPVSNDGTGYGPSVSNDGTVGAVLGGSLVSDDGTHVVYQSPLPATKPQPPERSEGVPSAAWRRPRVATCSGLRQHSARSST